LKVLTTLIKPVNSSLNDVNKFSLW